MLGFLLSAAAAAASASPPRDCQALLGSLYEGPAESELSAAVDGAAIGGPAGLQALRTARGDELLIVRGGRFDRADLRDARLGRICFLGTSFVASDWRGADVDGSAFVDADLSGARFEGAGLSRVLFRRPMLKDVDATGVDLSEARIDGGWDGSLEGLRLDGANLAGLTFDCGITIEDGCPLDRQISFRGTDLSGARIALYWGSAEDDWSGARIDRTEVSFHQLEPLAAAEIAGPLILRAGDEAIALSAAEHRDILRHIRRVSPATSASFDCAQADSDVERLVCEDDRLRALDATLAETYRGLGPATPSLGEDQRRWLRQRDRCTGEPVAFRSCVEESYERRLAVLRGRQNPPAWMRPGAFVLFVEPALEFDEAFQATPLYRRLVPLLAASPSHVAVRVNPDGSLDARGESVGGNAHLCSLVADRLRLDPATGWHSVERDPDADDPAPWRGRPVPVLLLWGDRAAVYRHGHAHPGDAQVDPRASDYASCGVRAGFGELVRVPVGDAEARAVFDSLDRGD